MTNWLPDLSSGSGPLYVRLAEQIESAVLTGDIEPGEKLPPQRNLAFDIGVTLGTVTRAYNLLKERGVTEGEVGRGTYIRGKDEVAVRQAPTLRKYWGVTPHEQTGMLLLNSTSAPEVGQAGLIARHIAEIAADDPRAISDYLRHVPVSWREAGKAWMSRPGWSPQTRDVLPTQGAHAALLAVVNAVTSAGDRIVFEELTYPATVRASILMGRRAIKVTTTKDGPDPEEFEHLCAQQHPRLAVFVSTINNPTLSVIPLENRLKLIETARRHNVMIIDDDTYGCMTSDAPPPLAALAPERTFHVTSLAKSVAAGLRSGYVACPPGHVDLVMNSHRLITGGAPRMLKETAARMVLSGDANRISDLVREDYGTRIGTARRILEGHTFTARDDCPFIWLKLPDPWVPSTFGKAARQHGVAIDEADDYKVAQMERAVPFVRIALTGALPADQVENGLTILRRLLDHPELAWDSGE